MCWRSLGSECGSLGLQNRTFTEIRLLMIPDSILLSYVIAGIILMFLLAWRLANNLITSPSDSGCVLGSKEPAWTERASGSCFISMLVRPSNC